jgi:hypothetical protein
MQPKWMAKRGWRLAVLRGVQPPSSPAHHHSPHFCCRGFVSASWPCKGPAALGGEPGSAAPTANRKPGMAEVSHCSSAAPRRALFNAAAPFRPAALVMGRLCPAGNTGRASMQPTWVAKRGWRLAVMRGVLPRISPAHYDSHHFLLSRPRSGRLALQGPAALGSEPGSAAPTANRKPGMAVVPHCSPVAPRRALYNAAPFRPAALAMRRSCPAVKTGRAL